MKFTVERKALVKMLQCVGKKHPTQTRRDKQVRLFALQHEVFDHQLLDFLPERRGVIHCKSSPSAVPESCYRRGKPAS